MKELQFMVTRFEQFVSAINGIHRCIQRIERSEMEKYGLKGYHAQYLMALMRYEEGVTAVQMCDICDVNKAAVSRSISELENEGLVVRRSREGTSTAYRATLVLTDKGKEAAKWVSLRAQEAVEKAGSGLSADDRAAMYNALENISCNLRAICKEALAQEQKV
jgi:DNA-binding MarR family transcriptional regulator